jgi:hypothetical protein
MMMMTMTMTQAIEIVCVKNGNWYYGMQDHNHERGLLLLLSCPQSPGKLQNSA